MYVIRVTARDGSSYHIGRRYRQFDEMQRLLEQRFPVEAGEFSQKERILPILPGKTSCQSLHLWHSLHPRQAVSGQECSERGNRQKTAPAQWLPPGLPPLPWSMPVTASLSLAHSLTATVFATRQHPLWLYCEGFHKADPTGQRSIQSLFLFLLHSEASQVMEYFHFRNK